MLHLEDLKCARDILDEYKPGLNHPVHLYLISINSLWRKLPYSNAVVLKVNEGFLNADQNVWQAIIQTSLSQRDPKGIL